MACPECVDAAQTAPYAAQLTANGYPAAYIAAGLNAVTAFQNADVAQNLAVGVANKALTDRNTAYASLSDWIKRVMHVAEDELRARPDLLKKTEALNQFGECHSESCGARRRISALMGRDPSLCSR